MILTKVRKVCIWIKNLQKQFITTINFHSRHSPLNLFYHSLCCFKKLCSLFQMDVMEEISILKNLPASHERRYLVLLYENILGLCDLIGGQKGMDID